MMGFERFESTGRTRSLKPIITIGKGGLINFNSVARDEYNIGDNPYCDIFYDKKNNKIGLKLMTEKIDKYSRRIVNNHGNYTLSIIYLCKKMGIDITTKHFYLPEKQEDLIVIDLKKPLKEG